MEWHHLHQATALFALLQEAGGSQKKYYGSLKVLE